MGVPTIDTGPMTVEDFYAFTDERPDHEKWELIDGEFVLNASPLKRHQVIVGNIIIFLGGLARLHGAAWQAIPGIGARISNTSRPEPDVMVLPKDDAPDLHTRDTDEALVLFEVMSPSTSNRDLRWKRDAYATLPALRHYVVVAQDTVEVVVFARDTGFTERRLGGADEAIALDPIGVSLPLSEIYRDTGLL